jgi:hypothetical protein
MLYPSLCHEFQMLTYAPSRRRASSRIFLEFPEPVGDRVRVGVYLLCMLEAGELMRVDDIGG